MKRFLIFIIKGYKKRISPHLGNNCRFKPSCSEYAMEALEIHGSAKGLLLASWRILRCNPFGKVGFDPVPPKGSWKNPQRHVWKEKQ
ncbi:membrane protein insertion efficiency factor YidD [Ruminococcaceae bacterium OttesenSCG-928-A16]|nr:membrane protein insertion efficiency factor YidD [Ruminococcaceae bacterium OttesenSCG-928-A16]